MNAAVQVYEGTGERIGRKPKKPRWPKEEQLPPGRLVSVNVGCYMKTGECSYCYNTVHRYYWISRRQAVRVLGEDVVALAERNDIEDMRRRIDEGYKRDEILYPKNVLGRSHYRWTVDEMVLWNKVNDTKDQWTREKERERRA